MHLFENHDFQKLESSLNLSGFSEAALKAWNKYAPKINKKTMISVFKQEGLSSIFEVDYLQGMVFSVSATK